MDVARFHALLTAIYDENEGARNAAAFALYRFMRDAPVHPADLTVELRGERHARTERVLQRHVDEITHLQRELAFFRQNADPSLLAKAGRAAQIENRWEAFRQLVGQRLGGFPNGWKATVTRMIGAKKEHVVLWEQGLLRIPDTAFEDMRVAAVPQKAPRMRAPAKPDGLSADR